MKWTIYTICFLLTSSFLWLDNDLPNNPPKLLELELDWNRIAKSKEVFTFSNKDTLISHEMRLLTDKNDFPLLYYPDIQTPVCIDGLCKPLYVELYWDLTGQYVGYGEFPNQILSKFDHEEFESADYEKLHQLLLDPTSILEKRKLSSLYDISQSQEEKIKFRGKEVDGVSGATKKEIKTMVVEGALYSCYTLWHLAYGEAVQKIKNILPTIYNDSLSNYFLRSNSDASQLYALKQLSAPELKDKIDLLLPILKNGKPLTRRYLFKKMPKSLFANAQIVSDIYPLFPSLDFNSKTLLIQNLQYSNPLAAAALSTQLHLMSKNQVKTYLEQLKGRSDFQSDMVVENLGKYATDDLFYYGYMVKDFLVTKKQK